MSADLDRTHGAHKNLITEKGLRYIAGPYFLNQSLWLVPNQSITKSLYVPVSRKSRSDWFMSSAKPLFAGKAMP